MTSAVGKYCILATHGKKHKKKNKRTNYKMLMHLPISLSFLLQHSSTTLFFSTKSWPCIYITYSLYTHHIHTSIQHTCTHTHIYAKFTIVFSATKGIWPGLYTFRSRCNLCLTASLSLSYSIHILLTPPTERYRERGPYRLPLYTYIRRFFLPFFLSSLCFGFFFFLGVPSSPVPPMITSVKSSDT